MPKKPSYTDTLHQTGGKQMTKQSTRRRKQTDNFCKTLDGRVSTEGKNNSIGRFGSTDASVSLGRVTARVTAEHPSFLCDWVKSKKSHRPGINSLLLALGPCSVALSFALPYLLPPTRDGGSTLWVNAGSTLLASPRALGSSRNDQCSPHPGPNLPEPPQIVALIF